MVSSALASALAVVTLGVSLAAQAPTTKATSPVPRTVWGTPDLNGTWTSETATPVERPDRFAGREFLTDQEIAELEKIRIERESNPTPGRDKRAAPGSERDVAGAYNAFWQSDGRVQKTGRRTSQIIDPPNGKRPAQTPEARNRQQIIQAYMDDLLQGSSGGRPGPPIKKEVQPPFYNTGRMNRADGPEDRSGQERCLNGGGMGSGGYYRIVQSADSVAIMIDQGQGQGFNRVIPITMTPHLPPEIQSPRGDSRAHWEGDTLIVDTTNFQERLNQKNLHIIERFTRTDANTLTYQVTTENPGTLTRPFTTELPWAKQDEKANIILEQACHEGNYGLLGMLSNTRAAERLFKEGKGPDPAKMDLATGGGGE
jgi:hypothetical protein